MVANCVKKTILCPLYTAKTSRMAFTCFLEKIDSEKDVFWEKKYFESKVLKRINFSIHFSITHPYLNRAVWNVSDLESFFLQLVMFWNEVFTACRFLIDFIINRQTWNQRLWEETHFEVLLFLEGQNFKKNSLSQTQFSASIYNVEAPILHFFVFPKHESERKHGKETVFESKFLLSVIF